jgi:ParB family chromosome partitioning protein
MSKVQKDRPRLGRGLSSLISMGAPPPEVAASEAPVKAPPMMREVGEEASENFERQPLEVPLSKIVPNPHQPRKQFSEATLEELAASIKSTGLIQPLVVRQEGEEYQLIAGERRWRAAKLAGLKAVPVLVREVDGFTQAQMALVENIQREDLNPLDRAGAYRTLMDQLGLTQAELAGRLGEDRSSIANHLRLLDLAEPVRAMVSSGELSLGHAKILASVAEPAEQERLAKLVMGQSLSVRNLERVVAEQATPKTRNPPAVSPHVANVEKSIARQLGMKAQLKSVPGKGKGKLVLHYASLDQFDELMQRLGVKIDAE